jgi:hypothetical protein
VDALAGGDKTRWDYFFQKKWAEVNTMIELENHKAYYRHQVHLKQEQQCHTAAGTQNGADIKEIHPKIYAASILMNLPNT